MKKLMTILVLTTAGNIAVLAQTNFYTNVTNLWYQGHKTNVLAIANTRLAANSNDIAGLILKADYHLEFSEEAALSNALLRVIQVGDTITTTSFVEEWQAGFSRYAILDLLDVIAKKPLTPQQIQAEKHKALIPHKPLPDADLLEALQKDGYFD